MSGYKADAWIELLGDCCVAGCLAVLVTGCAITATHGGDAFGLYPFGAPEP